MEDRVRAHLAALGLAPDQHIMVALSGGCDSVVLLYLLRFPLRMMVSAAHVDHAMRPDSAADARWVRGLCAAWEIPLAVRRLEPPPRTEEQARTARYHFLREQGADLIATAHHADDQAETVLFRALRGTGLTGLTGIPGLADGIVRPLLPFWRREIEAYGRARGLAWRTDPSNAGTDPVRNRIRHELLPLAERRIAPGARRNLVNLANLAGEAEAALERLSAVAEAELVEWDGEVPWLARTRLAGYDPAIQSRVLRRILRRLGVVLGRAGTRRTLQFITDARSGSRLPLAAGLQAEVSFDRVAFGVERPIPEDEPYRIEGPEAGGEASVRIGGEQYRIGLGGAADGEWVFRADPARLAFPLMLRGWRDGDRMGSRSLKRLFLDRRVPRARRHTLPVLVDARGEVLWVGGLAASPATGQESFVLWVRHA